MTTYPVRMGMKIPADFCQGTDGFSWKFRNRLSRFINR